MGNFMNSIPLAFVLRKHIIPLQSFTSFKSYYVSNSNLRFLFKEFYSKSRIFELFIIYFAYILISLLFNLWSSKNWNTYKKGAYRNLDSSQGEHVYFNKTCSSV